MTLRKGRFAGSNLPIVKRQNRSSVLRALFRYGPLSRTAIGRMTQLAPSTITNLIGELLAAGLVSEALSAEPSANDLVGRPPVLLDINPTGGLVYGAYVGAQNLTVSLGDLRANVYGSVQTRLSPELSPAGLVDLIVASVERLRNQCDARNCPVFGLGVTPAGRVDPERGILVELPTHPWRDVEIVAALRDRLAIPVATENSRRAMALAEMTFGHGQDIDSLLLVHGGTTIGCGVVVNRHVHAGDHLDAGRLGHTIVEENGELCSCGNRGCLETVASTAGIARIAATEMHRTPDSLLWMLCRDGSGRPTAEQVLQAASAGDPAAQRVMRRAGRALGHAIANAVLLLDPSRIVVAGYLKQNPLLLETLQTTLQDHLRRAVDHAVEVHVSALGPNELSLPGLTLALDRFVYSPALMLPTDPAGPVTNGYAAVVQDGPTPATHRVANATETAL